MKHLRKSSLLAVAAVSFVFGATPARAVPIPTIGAEIATQISQLQQQVEHFKGMIDQIKNGVEQAKAMGDKLSMDALKNMAMGQMNKALSGGISALTIPKEMEKAGFNENVAKDPEKVKDWVSSMNSGRDDNESFDKEKFDTCVAARESMKEELAVSNLANSLALQQNLSSGEDMKKAQEASGASDDQMQLIGANSATLKIMYQQAAASTVVEANRLASAAVSGLCQ